MIEVRQTDIFANWFNRLRDRKAKARVQARIDRIEIGNFGDVAPSEKVLANFAFIMVRVTEFTLCGVVQLLSYCFLVAIKAHKILTLKGLKKLLNSWRIE